MIWGLLNDMFRYEMIPYEGYDSLFLILSLRLSIFLWVIKQELRAGRQGAAIKGKFRARSGQGQGEVKPRSGVRAEGKDIIIIVRTV